jgi:NhaP-type Na+/H+ or K+/H+ antiporter
MNADAFYTAALALAAGMTAQAVASRFVAIPSIVLLLATGVLLGPDGLALLDPGVLGEARPALVSLAVTVILFEGGLALDLVRLRKLQRSLLLLLTLGAAISMAGGTLAAHAYLGMPWSIATLYGALMIVTGPTVVTPMLARLTVNRRVRELLVSEGVLIDAIGAIIAIVAAEYVVGHAAVLASGWQVFVRLVSGTLIGATAGLGLAIVLRRRWIAEDIATPFVLAVVLLVAAWASNVSAEAGLMAAVVQGAMLANAGLRGLRRLREFKEALTVLLLSFIFIILAADLRLEEVRALGWPALAVVGILVWVARPLAVLSCTIGSELTVRERLFASWICPRGIVAVAVAGLFRTLLDGAGLPGGNQLEALVFVTVAMTVTIQGLTAAPMARFLKVNVMSLYGTILVGAERFPRLLARLLSGMNRHVVMIDRSPRLCRIARDEGFSVYEGDALSFDILEDAGARYADTAVALTRNPELNALVARRIRNNFQVQRVLAITNDPEQGTTGTATEMFPGNFPGIDETNRLLRLGQLSVVTYDAKGSKTVGRSLADLAYAANEFAVLVGRGGSAFVATPKEKLASGDLLLCLRPTGVRSPLADALAEVVTLPAETAGEE